MLTAAGRLVELQREQGWEQPYAPGPVWAWGSNGRLLNNLVVLGTAYELAGSPISSLPFEPASTTCSAVTPWVRATSPGAAPTSPNTSAPGTSPMIMIPAFPPPPPGSLAGGPTNQAYPDFPDDPRLPDLPPQCAYLDQPSSETTNDICIRWNAPLVWVATFLTVTGR